VRQNLSPALVVSEDFQRLRRELVVAERSTSEPD